MFRKYLLGIFCIIEFVIITVIFALFDSGLLWEQLDESYRLSSHLLLITYRILIYSLPALSLILINRLKIFKLNLTVIDLFTIQFISFATVKLAWEFLALDYLWSTTLFDKIDSSIVIVSLILTLVFKKKVKISNDLI